MEQYLVLMNVMRRVAADEMQSLLTAAANEQGEIWVIGKKGSRRQVQDLKKYTPDQWAQLCAEGLVYVGWHQRWAFSPDCDEDGLPVMMSEYRKRFAPPAEQTTMNLDGQTAGDAGTTPTT